MNLAVRLSGAMVVLVLFTATTLGLLVYWRLEASVLPWRLERLKEHAGQHAEGLARHVAGARTDILALSASGPAVGLVREAGSGSAVPWEGRAGAELRARLAENMAAFLAARPAYLQLRLLGADGHEVVRMDRSSAGGAVRIRPPAELQPKGDRPYFLNASRLPIGEVYVSPIELNQEHGAIEQPLVPVLRVGTPVGAPDGRPIGVIVVNVDMRPTLDAVRQAGRATGGEMYVVDGAGNYLVHPDPDREHGSELGRPARFGTDFPQLAEAVRAPTASVREIRVDGERLAVAVAPVRLERGPTVAVVEVVPHGTLVAVAPIGRSSVLAALLATGAALVLAAILARSVARPLGRMTAAVEAFRWGQRIEVPVDAAGEIGVLARAFGRMTAALERETEERRRVEERFRLVVESAPSGMLIVDALGRIQLVNAGAELLFGYRRDELLGEPVERLVPGRFRSRHPELRAGFMAAPEMRQMGVGRDLRAVRRDGSELPVEVGLSPLEAREGPQVLCTVVDITARKTAEEALSERTRELERSNADLEQFAYVASHDLQEPLRMVASYSQLLGDRYRGQLDERADKYIHHLVDGAHRMQQLVYDLLAYSRVGTQGAALEPTDSGKVVDNVLAALHRAIEESGAEIVRGAAPQVLADELQLGQVFQNLLANALKFRRDEAPRVRIDAERIHGAWRFSVADNGIGMDKEHATRIFQMFQRLHERGKYPGNGIGLAITKKIVERHGGKIWFESNPGEGTTFYFTIPTAGEIDT